MRSTSIVFDMERAFVSPVVTDQLIDKSRYHHNGTAYNITSWERLPSGLYCPKMVSASSGYYLLPNMTPLLGARQATWLAWVRKDAYISTQNVMSDNNSGAGNKNWTFGYENVENRWCCWAGDGTTQTSIIVAGAYTAGWHFVWMRFTGGSVTGLETGCDSSVGTPVSTAAIAALGAVANSITRIGRALTVYSSMTLATLRIHNVALTDGEIYQYRESTRKLIGV